MPLADHPGVVAALLQQTRDRHAGAVEPVEDRHAVDVRVLPGQDRRAARGADGIGREDVLEEHAFAGQTIQVRRLVHPRPVRPDGVRGVIVGHDEHDVRAVGAEGDTGGESSTGRRREEV